MLRGPFFAVGDEALLEWTHRFGATTTRGSGASAPSVPGAGGREGAAEVWYLPPVAEARAPQAPASAAQLRPVAETLHELLGEPRPRRRSRCEPAESRRSPNAFHVAELARQFETGGGYLVRGFVDELRVAADNAVAAEAPILEEDSDGVRMMTVHKAKGLEFPIVILADLTCKLARAEAGRWIPTRAQRLRAASSGWLGADGTCCCTTRRNPPAMRRRPSGWPTCRHHAPAHLLVVPAIPATKSTTGRLASIRRHPPAAPADSATRACRAARQAAAIPAARRA